VMPGEVKILNIAQMSSTTWNRIGMVRVSSVPGWDYGHRPPDQREPRSIRA
jgi:hypothetical protein